MKIILSVSITDADAEQMEVQHWVSEALDCGYISGSDAAGLIFGLEEIGRMLNSMMTKADAFCSSPDGVLREHPTDSFTTDESPLITDP